jgi:hypothetical protein
MKKWIWIGALLVMGTMAISLVFAQAAGGKDFKDKFKQLTAKNNNVFKVSARPGEDVPEATLNLNFGPGATISVSRGGPPKDMLEDGDITGVVNRNLRTVKFCYCEALKKDPQFEGQAIVGLQIQTSGKVDRVEIQPDDMAENRFGKCLAPRVAKWSFPSFNGKKEDGLTVKSIGYEFPLEFNRAAE